jgi:hypothetical protein
VLALTCRQQRTPMEATTITNLPFEPSAVYQAALSHGKTTTLVVRWYDWSIRPVAQKQGIYSNDDATTYAQRLRFYRPDLGIQVRGGRRLCR